MPEKEPRPIITPGQAFKRAVLRAAPGLLVVLTPCCDRRMRIFPGDYHHRRTHVRELRFCPQCRRLWKVELFRRGEIWSPVAEVSI